MQEYRNINYPAQIIEAQQEADTRWTCFLGTLQFTLSNAVFTATYELNT